MSRKNYTFTSESVSEGHPDKVCDRISDAVLDAFLAEEPEARVAAETFATTNRVVIGGEVGLSDQDKLQDYMGRIEQIARECIKDIGYEQDKFHHATCEVTNLLHEQEQILRTDAMHGQADTCTIIIRATLNHAGLALHGDGAQVTVIKHLFHTGRRAAGKKVCNCRPIERCAPRQSY